ncbi:hypothetical protein D3C72_2374450 [compost metagenome]
MGGGIELFEEAGKIIRVSYAYGRSDFLYIQIRQIQHVLGYIFHNDMFVCLSMYFYLFQAAPADES